MTNLTKSILSDVVAIEKNNNTRQTQTTVCDEDNKNLNPFLVAGIGTFFILNIGVLLSLPPVLMGRGAPYLPTFNKGLDAMFHQLKKDTEFQKKIANRNAYNQQTKHVPFQQPNLLLLFKNFLTSSLSSRLTLSSLLPKFIGNVQSSSIKQHNNTTKNLDPVTDNSNIYTSNTNESTTAAVVTKIIFVDLGSGDGRVVFRAAEQQLFDTCIGYEINPLLHIVAIVQQIIGGPYYWNNKTQFFIKNLWHVNLYNADVVAVYGLGPIMKELGIKLEKEMKPGSIVLSNVFAIPGWNAVSNTDGVYLYRIPNRNNTGTSSHDKGLTH